jgi:hypothetical protein
VQIRRDDPQRLSRRGDRLAQAQALLRQQCRHGLWAAAGHPGLPDPR